MLQRDRFQYTVRTEYYIKIQKRNPILMMHDAVKSAYISKITPSTFIQSQHSHMLFGNDAEAEGGFENNIRIYLHVKYSYDSVFRLPTRRSD
jgi:hypothetical protein